MFIKSPTLEGNNLSLRPMVNNDFDGLLLCGGNKKVWTGHPNPDRYKKDNFTIWFSDAINSGNALTIIDKNHNEIIGSTRFYFEGTPENAVSIGYTFLAYKCWGGVVNHELKTMMLNYAFKTFSAVWFHISPKNIRSQKAILNIGAKHIKNEKIALTIGKPIVWKLYKIDRSDWFS